MLFKSFIMVFKMKLNKYLLLSFIFIITSYQAIALTIERIVIESDEQQYVFDVEIAKHIVDIKKGLMGRKNLKNDHGMLFIFNVTVNWLCG